MRGGYLLLNISVIVEGKGQDYSFFKTRYINKYVKYFISFVMKTKNQRQITFLFLKNRLEKQKS